MSAAKHTALAAATLALVPILAVVGSAGGAGLGSPDKEAPSVPANIRVTSATSSTVSLAWDASTDNVGVSGYLVYVNGQRSRVETTEHTARDLPCGESAGVGIVAYDRTNNRSERATTTVSTAPCPDVQPPTPPANFRQAATTQTSVVLEWDASSDNVGVVGYGLYRDGVLVESPSSTTATLTGLSCDSVYQYEVDAKDAAGNRSQRRNAWVQTSACTDGESPSTPTGLVVTARTDSSITLSWAASNDNVGVAGYRVLLAGVPVQTVSQPGASISNLACNTAYVVGVDAFDEAGNRSTPATVTATTEACPSAPPPPNPTPPPGDKTPPSEPTGLSVTASTRTSVSLGWAPSTDDVGVKGYGVYVNGTLAQEPSQPGATMSGLACGTAYDFGVDAFDAAGNRSNRASVIATTSACADTQAPTAPSNLVATSRTATSIALSWSASSDNVGVVGYGLYRGGSPQGTATGTTGIFSGLTCNTNYTLAVDAYDAAGNRSGKTSVMVSTTACPDTTPPSTPTGLAASSIAPTSLTLTWNPSSDSVGVTGYDVYRGGTVVATVTSTSSQQSGLACATAYWFGVVARDAAGNSSAKTSINPSTAACETPPPSLEWVFCANEGQQCSFAGTKEVRYGANGTFTTPRAFSGGVGCNNQVFGDPLVGVLKHCEYLAGSSEQPPSSPPPSGNFPASFYTGPAGAGNILPPKQGVFVGTAQSGSYADVEQQLAALESYLGRKVDIEHRFMQGTCSLDPSLISAIASRGHIPMISWIPDPRNGGAILRGDADQCIRQVGAQIASQPHKLLLRPYWEFNGDWYDHSKDLDGSLLTPDEHKAMWRRTVDQLRAAGAFPKASMVWCPGEGHFHNGDQMNEDVAYPGDNYVDWVCSDGYNANNSGYCGTHSGWCAFSEVFTHGGLAVGVEETFRGRKPFMVGETASVEDPSTVGRKGQWIVTARDYIKTRMPGMNALIWFDVGYVDGDWRINTSDSSKQSFRDLALDPYFNTR